MVLDFGSIYIILEYYNGSSIFCLICLVGKCTYSYTLILEHGGEKAPLSSSFFLHISTNIDISVSPYITSSPKETSSQMKHPPYSFSKGKVFTNETYPFIMAFLKCGFSFHTFYSLAFSLCNSRHEKHCLEKPELFLNIPLNQRSLH